MTLSSGIDIDQFRSGFTGASKEGVEDSEAPPSMAEITMKILEEQEELNKSMDKVRPSRPSLLREPVADIRPQVNMNNGPGDETQQAPMTAMMERVNQVITQEVEVTSHTSSCTGHWLFS